MKNQHTELTLHNASQIKELSSEYQYEQAITLIAKLRWLSKENPSLKSVRKHLKTLVKQYEAEHWSKEEDVTEEQLIENKLAELIALNKEKFILNRKELIQNALKKYKLKQKDLGFLLGHRPNYTSELMNGAREFSKKDIFLINRLFRIPLEKLMYTYVDESARERVKEFAKNNNVRLKLNKEDLEYA